MSFTADRPTDSADLPMQDGRSLAIETPLGKDAVILIALDGIDRVSRGFVYTIEFMTRAGDDQIRTLLAKPVTLWLHNNSETARRPLHGHVRHLTRLNQDGRLYRRWRAEIVPQMWFLTCNVDCRIYQNLSPVQIITSIFDEYGLSHYQFRLLDTYQQFGYCVQYRESAFDFVSRLMEQAGIAYWFEHAEDRHVLVMSDSNRLAPFCQPRKARLSERADLGEIQEVTQDFGVHTGHWALGDFDFEVPTKNLRTRQSTVFASMMAGGSEKFDYPGHYTSPEHGKWLTRLRIEEEEVQHAQMSGLGSCVGFDPGRRFEFEQQEATGAAQVAEYFLTEVRHTASQPINYNNTDQPATYSNRFVCIPAEVPFRPERLTARPVIAGLQTATVVGPSGESIHVDKYGRIRVLFHWDRRGKRDEHASCWIRVSQQSAGAQYGGVAIPHVGHEVIVSFLEGDPDRPLIVGNVHNGTNMPPINLPADKNKTMLRDHGDNKIIMHGKAGKQHLSLVSPRSLNMFAVRGGAKALSAAATFVSQDGKINDEIDGSLNGTELDELLTMFNALDNPGANKDTNTAGQTLTGPAGTADAAATIDINSMSEGNINSLSLQNTNTWVYQDSISWVNRNGFSTILGYSISNVSGSVTSTIDGSSTTSIGGDAVTGVNGNNATTVQGNNTSAIIGTNDSFLMGLSSSLIMGGAVSLVTPLSMQVFLGLNGQLTAGLSYQAASTNMQLFGTNIQHNGINLSWDDLTIDVKETHIEKKDIKMSASDFELNNSALLLFL